MDSSFTGSGAGFFASKSSAPSAFLSRPRQSSVAANRKSLAMKKSLGTGRYSLAGHRASNAHHLQQPQFVSKSDSLDVQSFGLPLPVLVNEALTFSDRNATVTIGCSDNGWAWAVAGRRLLVWQHSAAEHYAAGGDGQPAGLRHTPQRRSAPSGQCRELTLPHCDIGHKAGLVCVFVAGECGASAGQMASCLAVSPAGDVRYWPSIAHDGSSIDAGGVMDGQEFDAMVALPGVGYMLATTTCNLLLLQLQPNNGRHTIVHRPVRPPTGFLGGIGRRFASIIVGMQSAQEREHKLIRLCASGPQRSGTAAAEFQLTVLADRWIQRWSVNASTGAETYLFEDFELFKQIRDAFHQKLWSQRDVGELDVRLLDMHTAANRTVLVLAAAINAAHTPQLHYALCTFGEQSPASGGGAFALRNFCQLRHTAFVSGTATVDSVPPMRLLVDGSAGVAFVYDDKHVLQATLTGADELCGSGEPSERVEFNGPAERIMAGVLLPLQPQQLVPVVFLRQHGFASVQSTLANAEYGGGFDFLNGSVLMDMDNTLAGMAAAGGVDHTNLSMFELNPDEVYDDSDAVSQLKAAFIYHLKKNAAKCSEVLAELLDTERDIGLDALVVKIARDLVDDVPAADPRWEEQQIGPGGQSAALGSSTSMQIIQQLKDKRIVLQHFVEFLHAVDVWPRLQAHADRAAGASAAAQRPTAQLLSDISEKVVAAVALKKMHAAHSRLLDEAIQVVLRQRNEQLLDASSTLTVQDLFYVKVTRLHEIVRALAGLVVGPDATTAGAGTNESQRLSDVNALVLAMLAEVHKSRTANQALYAIAGPLSAQFEYLPWTAQTGRSGLRDALQQLIGGALRSGARATGEPELRQRHYKQMVELIDYVLDGRKSHLDSVQDGEKYSVLLQQYEAQRADLIQPLVQDEQYELATKLAEKYLDFQTLVQICDRTENQARLDEYIRKYQQLNFSQFAINWHLRQNKRGDLFERFKHQQADLSRFLTDHPSLAWVQAVFNGDMSKAGRVLLELAEQESELVARKKTMLSLAKLVSLAADEDLQVQVDRINAELRLIEYQSALGGDLLEAFGYDANEQKVMKPLEIINLLIAEENTFASEAEYRRALEMLAYIDDPDEVRLQIWCSAILRDNWQVMNVNAPQEDLQNFLFFKLVDLCFFMDADLQDCLPPLEEFLQASQLEELATNKSFQYLFKLGYEYIGESYAQRM